MLDKMSDSARNLLIEISSKGYENINYLNYTSKVIGEVIDYYRLTLKPEESQDKKLILMLEKLSEIYNNRISELEFNGYHLDDEWAYLAELKGQSIPNFLLSSIHREKLDSEQKWNLLKEYIKNEKRETSNLFHEQRISAAEKETWLKVWKKIENKMECLDSVGVKLMNPKDFDFSMKNENL